MKSKLQEMYKAHRSQVSTGREARLATAREMIEFLEDGTINAEDVSLREVFDLLVVQGVREDKGIDFNPQFSEISSIQEDIVSSMFPTITGKLFHQTLIKAYEPASNAVQKLFMQTTSAHREETVVGLTAGARARHVEEGMPFPEAQIGEKRCLIRNHKFGQKTSLTAEAVLFDQTGEVLNAARTRGSYLADLLEEFACYRLQDVAWGPIDESTSQAFVYGGTRYAIWADTHTTVDGQVNDNNVGTGARPNIEQVENGLNLLAQMKDEKGNPIRIRPKVVYGHEILAPSINRFFNYQDYDIDSAERNANPYKNSVQVFTSPFFSNSTKWHYGDPASQFRMQWVRKPTTDTAPGDPTRDVLMSFLSSMFVGIGATDYRFVIENAGA